MYYIEHSHLEFRHSNQMVYNKYSVVNRIILITSFFEACQNVEHSLEDWDMRCMTSGFPKHCFGSQKYLESVLFLVCTVEQTVNTLAIVDCCQCSKLHREVERTNLSQYFQFNNFRVVSRFDLDLPEMHELKAHDEDVILNFSWVFLFSNQLKSKSYPIL